MTRYPFFLALSLSLAVAGSAGAVTSAELYRPEAHTFGKFEARLGFAAGDGVVGAFFLWKDGSELSDAYWNELDFEKIGAACELQTNSMYGNPERGHTQRGYGLEGLCSGYHTYTFEWTPDYIAWFVDGTELRRDTGEDAAAYAENAMEGLQFRFNIWPGDSSFGGNFQESSLPVYEFVAWAQYSEYTPGAGDDGSDFTLAWREEFDARPAGWQTGSWPSPKNLSTHGPQNVVFKDGIAVLALTSDDATGFTGNPPPDDGSVWKDPVTGGPPPGGGGGGCGCRLTTDRAEPSGIVAFLACAAMVWVRRRRERAS